MGTGLCRDIGVKAHYGLGLAIVTQVVAAHDGHRASETFSGHFLVRMALIAPAAAERCCGSHTNGIVVDLAAYSVDPTTTWKTASVCAASLLAIATPMVVPTRLE